MLETGLSQALVAYACNPSYSGGGDQEKSQPWADNSQTLSWKKPNTTMFLLPAAGDQHLFLLSSHFNNVMPYLVPKCFMLLLNSFCPLKVPVKQE
jgi:hypothetical protein